jgi:hypothetical protein
LATTISSVADMGWQCQYEGGSSLKCRPPFFGDILFWLVSVHRQRRQRRTWHPRNPSGTGWAWQYLSSIFHCLHFVDSDINIYISRLWYILLFLVCRNRLQV